MKKKAIIVSGYFNPLHRGHIEYFSLAKQNGDILVVIINNDIQRSNKGSKEFMLEGERELIISNLKLVDKTYISIDTDRTVTKTIEMIHTELKKNYELFFANGGDQINKSIPESDICNKLGISLIDNLGDKIQSSSWLLKK
jgi:glycerol-3-phosphate cytidylyltransferase/D-beta-D-heptose 7-phosphate kinase/D-beta-D-heptose 1-phosphate adenosyltransferase